MQDNATVSYTLVRHNAAGQPKISADLYLRNGCLGLLRRAELQFTFPSGLQVRSSIYTNRRTLRYDLRPDGLWVGFPFKGSTLHDIFVEIRSTPRGVVDCFGGVHWHNGHVDSHIIKNLCKPPSTSAVYITHRTNPKASKFHLSTKSHFIAQISEDGRDLVSAHIPHIVSRRRDTRGQLGFLHSYRLLTACQKSKFWEKSQPRYRVRISEVWIQYHRQVWESITGDRNSWSYLRLHAYQRWRTISLKLKRESELGCG